MSTPRGWGIPRRRRELEARIEGMKGRSGGGGSLVVETGDVAETETETVDASSAGAAAVPIAGRSRIRGARLALRSSRVESDGRPAPVPLDAALFRVDSLIALPRVDPRSVPEDSIFLDLETTGLGGNSLVALAGTLRREGDRFRLRQLVAFGAADERSVLESLLGEIAHSERVITYNGRSFDLPFLARRLRWHRLPALSCALRHRDLLLEVRRRYRREWPDCSLGTAEQRLLSVRRPAADVPGSEVPRRFADVREGAPPALITPIILHNRFDLTSLVALHLQLEG